MAEIRFRVNHNHEQEAYERDIVERTALIVCGRLDLIVEEEEGYRWQLDSSNDWKMDKDQMTGEFILFYRYGNGPEMEEKMKALRLILLWRLDVERFN